jgi:transcriptional regulator with XRE-family HTH domain
VDYENSISRLPILLKELREERGISLRQLADNAGVDVSVAARAERGADARVSTWEKLFEGLGCFLLVETPERSDEEAEFLSEEAERRRERRLEGLCAGKRRFY